MSAPSKKRQRVVQVSAKRPIDKNLISITQGLSTTQQETVLLTVTFPSTIVGLRWSLSFHGAAASATNYNWAIVVVRDGLSASTMSMSDAGDFYTPEQDVLAFGNGRCTDLDLGAGPGNRVHEGATKTMRKMKGGDQLIFITDASAIQGQCIGIVQFFRKS